jgi:glycosyltransferase involved in cell wall biosynthesis
LKKILISAYAVSPIRGSECAVGWEITRRLGNFFDTTVIVCEKTPSGDNYKEEVESYLTNFGLIPNVKFVYIPMPKISKIYTLLHDFGFWPAYYFGYNCWQRKVYRSARYLHQLNKYDACYQLNMIGFREPGYLWKLDIPFFWGPINGFHSIPYSFLKDFHGKDYILQYIKRFFNELQIKIALRPKIAAKKASFVWCVDAISLNNIKKWTDKVDLLTETGLTHNSLHQLSSKIKYYKNRSLNLVWSGRIEYGKSLSILIDSLLLFNEYNFKLVVLGDGPLLNEMKKRSEPIKHKIIWNGWLPKHEAINLVSNSDLLIHTSLKEGTPHVILEAISYRVPVICHDTCGMSTIVNDQNGFKIPYKNFHTSIVSLSDLLSSIFDNPDILNCKFESINEPNDFLTWDHKVSYISEKINTIINNVKN